jgi:NitT/TauT family transport system permease protein
MEIIRNIPEILFLSFLSLTRILGAYIICLAAAIIISYISTSGKKIEKLIIAILDILQSIPVLSFTPAVMLFFYKLGYLGWEIATLVLIITGMVWNMIFSFYSSIKSLPEEALEVAKSLRLDPIRRFFVLDFPFSLPALAFNSVMSFAGGWYFLMYCEMFSIGEIEVKVPGIGSFILSATERGDLQLAFLGFLSMSAVITISYLIIWRPIIRLSYIFKYEFEHHEKPELSSSEKLIFSAVKKIMRRFSLSKAYNFAEKIIRKRETISDIMFFSTLIFLTLFSLLLFLRFVNLKLEDIIKTILSIFPTFFRVIVGVGISAAVSIPIAIFLGLKRNLADKIMPAIQVLSSIPATAFLPIMFAILSKIPYGIELNAIAIISLSSIWYIFYNTLAGVRSIPQEVLDVAESIRMGLKDKIKKIIIPGSAKDMFVGFLTAWGGAWNGSFVAEFIEFKGEEYKLFGIGYMISESAEKGNKDLMIFSTITMASFIALVNILVWRKILEKISAKVK